MVSLNTPWIIIGDFNAITHMHEQKGGSHYYYIHNAHYFSAFISSNSFLDVNFMGV